MALRNGEDIAQLAALDQKLWVALACPTRGIEFDYKTLDLIDLDKDGRIRVPEVIGTIQWAGEIFKNLDDLVRGADVLPLTMLNEKTELGAAILSGAKRILENLGKPHATSISFADVADTNKIFTATKLNGDGIVPADSAPDAPTQKVIDDITTTLGGLTDRSGKLGVDQAKVEAFYSQAAALATWEAQKSADAKLLPLNDATAAAAAALAKVKSKVDDYFTRCRLAAFDPRASAAMNRSEAELVNLSTKELHPATEEIAKLPLARVEADRALPLSDGINPAWTGAIAELQSAVISPLLGTEKSSLTLSEWQTVQDRLAPFQAWMAARPVTAVDKLGLSIRLVPIARRHQLTRPRNHQCHQIPLELTISHHER